MERIEDLKVERGETAKSLTRKLGTTGFQGSWVSDAAELIKKMRKEKCTVFLTFTANMMASGLRGIFTQMIEEGLVDAVITTGGSIDHDIIKSHKPYLLGDYYLDDVKLHKKGVNRIGNILVPNNRYLLLERKIGGYFKAFNRMQDVFAPSELNEFMGSQLPKGSFLNACNRKAVPVFCPGMVDSAIGMHLYFYRQDHKDFIMNPAADLERLGDIVFNAKKTGGIVLGGGISKHHLIGANLMRGGLDYAVYVTTAAEYDGSLSGAQPREAKSWGKIKETGSTVTVHCDATLALPLITAAIR
ncbi:MAG: deoxyhypusine synthase [Candidatus Altiarchaeales archaeon]|nr:deoxyhypusine synthase [Candidatus Altiarchaeales archaeon]MBD3416754.1 deoxyhypusine synthase [Candidatus Altiarchaeales archaeon]